MAKINQIISSFVGSLSASCCASRESVQSKSAVGLRSAELSVVNKDGFVSDNALLPVTTEFRLIHVDSKGNYQFTSVQHAIDNASDGDRIFIHSGQYLEWIQITKCIELIGVGPVDSVTIEVPNSYFDRRQDDADNALVTVEAAQAKMRNLTISRKDGSGVVIENGCGDLVVEGCAIYGGGTGIRVSNSATVIARYCDVTGCTAHGVMSCSSGWISLEKCCVSNCFHGAFSSDLGTQCSIKDCDILNSSQVGLVLHDEAQVTGPNLMQCSHSASLPVRRLECVRQANGAGRSACPEQSVSSHPNGRLDFFNRAQASREPPPSHWATTGPDGAVPYSSVSAVALLPPRAGPGGAVAYSWSLYTGLGREVAAAEQLGRRRLPQLQVERHDYGQVPDHLITADHGAMITDRRLITSSRQITAPGSRTGALSPDHGTAPSSPDHLITARAGA